MKQFKFNYYVIKMRFVSIFVLCASVCCIQCNVHDGFTINPENGHGYKIMYNAQPWSVARDVCESLDAKLAIPKSEEEFKFIQKLVRTMHYPSIVGTRYKLLVWLGISNLENNAQWINIDGENIQDTGFHAWASHNGNSFSDDPAEPHCVGMDAANFGLRNYWCNENQPYVCEIKSH